MRLRRLLLLTCFGLAAAAPPALPPPYATASAARGARVVGWCCGERPTVPSGFAVTLYAEGLENGRWLYQLPNGDVLVAQASTGETGAGLVTLLRDAAHAGHADQRFAFLTDAARQLDRPFGMALIGHDFYIATTDALWRYAYTEGATTLDPATAVKLIDLPASGYNNHWTRNLLASPDGTELYVTVGSGTNVDLEGVDRRDKRRAAILRYTLATRAWTVFASGLRNANGLDWNPATGALWAAVNERDGLGDDLVPDFATSVTEGGFYGWPYYYYGIYEDPRHKGERPDLAGHVLVPDLPLGSHHAPLGMTFYRGHAFPERYRGGLFVGEHGSWNRSALAGYRVAFVPFNSGGAPSGPPEAFAEGFIADAASHRVHGRPVDVLEASDGSLLVTDDTSGKVWRIVATTQ